MALDLIGSGSLANGIDQDDARGLKIVTRCARDAERLRQRWRETLKRAEADRLGDPAEPGDSTDVGFTTEI